MQVTNLFNSNSLNFTSRSDTSVCQDNPYIKLRQTTHLNNTDQILFTSKKKNEPNKLSGEDIKAFVGQVGTGKVEPGELGAFEDQKGLCNKIKEASRGLFAKTVRKKDPEIVDKIIEQLDESSIIRDPNVIRTLGLPELVKGKEKQVTTVLMTHLAGLFGGKDGHYYDNMYNGVDLREEAVHSLVKINPKKSKKLYKTLHKELRRYQPDKIQESNFAKCSPKQQTKLIMDTARDMIRIPDFYIKGNSPEKVKIVELITKICPK